MDVHGKKNNMQEVYEIVIPESIVHTIDFANQCFPKQYRISYSINDGVGEKILIMHERLYNHCLRVIKKH